MTTMPERRAALPLLSHARGKRSAVTCELKCGNACADDAPNTSENEYFRDLASRAFTRRRMLGGVGGGALAVALSPASPAAAHRRPGHGHGPARGLSFQPIAPVAADVDALTVPRGWTWRPVIRWGDPLSTRAPEFDPEHQSERAQMQQFGYNCDYLDIIETPGTHGRRALAVVNHEYTNENIMFPPSEDADTLEEYKRIAMAAHGLSVVELRRSGPGRPWSYVRGSRYNRRIHLKTRFAVDGPAAGHPLLRTREDHLGRTILGTQNNCSGGTTPWGTVLSGEENFNQYFVADDTPENRRYGIPSTEGGRAWWTVEPRFDARRPGYENEVNRFGWVVEVDPEDPDSTPVKHTAMGRFKHESANIRLARDGRAVAYSGDDERFDYLYKFVSTRRMVRGSSRWAKAQNKRLLSSGDLYVARFSGDSPPAEIDGTGALPSDGRFDGTGEWVPLVEDGCSRVPGMSVAEVLVFTRLAADRVGATKMDRPEDVQPNPVTGRVYAALTNNTNRGVAGYPGVDEANPRVTNREGHVLELTEYHNDAGATRFAWTLLLVCGDPSSAGTYFGGYEGPVSPISCPDNVAFDSTGALWIATDGQPGTLGLDDALHRVTLTGRERGKVEQFLAVPREAETCGPVVHDRDGSGSVFVAVQHPGEDGSWADQHSFFPDYAAPGTLSRGRWGGPRPSVVQVYRR
ncbi:PhoX family protein [Phycicoccus endophyticus]|uniref:PhoX family protein n=1 Tax=Phycicoccus endophyticus TaxID=1690220 RepID=A0A7G9QZG0_9MICO|nr:PhoX family phosphatase [Phycicoccus endophyticus]NHI19095.1 PhoX family protein [Phycicoccus endophyticus]QNN48735.1 PhoX family protein [Phycicoccus endophyticus]GGL32755.1 phosphatase [Phycicoccus endophyticus]